MKDKCYDIGTIQAFLDGELADRKLDEAARHIAACDACSRLLAEAEDESSIACAALEQEFGALVPTQRLWTKINDSIESERATFWRTVRAFFMSPAAATCAGLLIVFGFTLAYFEAYENYRNYAGAAAATTAAAEEEPPPSARRVEIESFEMANAAETSGAAKASETFPGEPAAAAVKQPSRQQAALAATTATMTAATAPARSSYKIINAGIKTNARAESFGAASGGRFAANETLPASAAARRRAEPALIAGEESYVNTIAALEKNVDQRKDEVLRPSERFAYENDLAIVDDAIRKVKSEVKRNPKNEAAKEALIASYRHKIDLLSSVSEKSELLAGLK